MCDMREGHEKTFEFYKKDGEKPLTNKTYEF